MQYISQWCQKKLIILGKLLHARFDLLLYFLTILTDLTNRSNQSVDL